MQLNHPYRVALVGNQNCGKTTLFNKLTGDHQHVGNWPGVTVERRTGSMTGHDHVQLLDLPGIYSLSSYSQEETITRDLLLQDKPDLMLNVVDATNLERNLYLTLQLLWLGIPVMIALTMMDEVSAMGDVLQVKALAQRLGVQVIPVSARRSKGILNLKEALLRACKSPPRTRQMYLPDDEGIRQTVQKIQHALSRQNSGDADKRSWMALWLLEGDNVLLRRLTPGSDAESEIRGTIADFERRCGQSGAEILASHRYRQIERILSGIYTRGSESVRRKWTKRVDDIVLHPLAAYPLLGLVMFGIFRTAFGTLGQGMSNKLTAWLTSAAVWLGGMLEQIGVSSGLRGLVIDGMIVGVSSVLSFTPVIMLLFLCLSLLEGCGYMARAAFLMDKPLQAIGLTGRSFIPMLMGFGCSVPAVMAARSMHTDRDRRLTILLIPFISCGAKLPVYALLASAFFPDMADAAASIVCLGGLLVGIGCGKVLSSTFLRSRGEPFIMELPPYRMPSMENVMRNIWHRLSDFLTRAFTVILLSSVLIWFLCTYNSRFQIAASLQSSMLGEVAGVVTVFLRPLGFGSPEAASAVLTGLLAKESIISTLAVTLGTGTTGDELKLALRVLFPTDAAACSFLTFVMLYTPCVAAMTTIRRELGSRRETLLCAAGQMGLAWLCAYVIYHALM